MNTPETRTMDPEFLHMLKTGLSKEEFKVTEAQVAGYPKDFVQFMDLMIAEKKVKRNEIAARTGLSIGYLYKLLNGSRHTDDRDYIIAICFALHLNLAQAQHALRCNGSPLLSADDDRAAYIMRGLIYGLDLYKMNECLSRLNLCMIRVSQDMPKAPIKDSLFSIEKDPVLSDEDETDESDPSETAAARLPNIYDAPKMRHTYVEIESSAEAVHDGNAWFDFDVFGVMTVQDEDTDEIFHISAAYFAAGDSYFAVQTDEQYKEYVEQEEKYHKSAGNLHIEMYDDFSDVAAKSEFFPSFMQLDRLTDLKLEEALRKVDDTKNYGVRFGAHWMGGDSPEMYIEMFNDQEPENRSIINSSRIEKEK